MPLNVKKYVNAWRNKVRTKKAFRSFTRSSFPFRLISGNFDTPVLHRNLFKNYTNSILKYLKSRPLKTPTLYKGIRNKNANTFRTTGVFKTRAPTSSSIYWTEAMKFTNFKDPVLLIIPPGKYHAAFMGRRGIHSSTPLEYEVVLPPGRFKKVNRKNGNLPGYRVEYIENN